MSFEIALRSYLYGKISMYRYEILTRSELQTSEKRHRRACAKRLGGVRPDEDLEIVQAEMLRISVKALSPNRNKGEDSFCLRCA